jgi:hypothetical protein
MREKDMEKRAVYCAPCIKMQQMDTLTTFAVSDPFDGEMPGGGEAGSKDASFDEAPESYQQQRSVWDE